MPLTLPIVSVFVIYVSIVLLIGFIAGRMTKNISEFILAGRKLSGALTALGAGASDMSGWLLMGVPGAVFINGINQIWLPIGLSIGAYLNWQFVAKRLRIFTEIANNSLTVPAYLGNRFCDESKLLRRVTGIVVLIFFTFYASAGFVGGGLLTQTIFHLPYLYALLLSASVIILYTCIGGFLAVSWIDFFQGTLMFFALLTVPLVTLYHLDGIPNTLHLLAFKGQSYFNAFHSLSLLGIVSLLAWGLGYFGQPHIIVRFMAARSSKEIPVARFICMTWMTLALYGAIFTGIVGAAYYQAMHMTIHNPETIFLMLAQFLFNPWIAGILLAAVLSAIMSTVSAQLLASATSLTEDLYRDLVRPNASPQELMFTARTCVFLIAVVAVVIAATASKDSAIMHLVAYAWSGLGASFGPIVLISLYWRGMTRNSAVAGIIVGALTVIIWEILNKKVGGIFELYSILPAFVLNSLTIGLVGYFGKKPAVKVTQQFDLALEHMT